MFGIALPFVLDFVIRVLPIKIKQFFTIDRIYNILGCLAVLIIVACLFINIFAGKSLDLVYKFSAVLLAISLGYFVNKKKIRYVANQGLKIGLLKALIIIGCISLLYVVFDLIFAIESYLCLIVYLFLGLFCTIILPILFKFLFKKGYENEKSNN